MSGYRKVCKICGVEKDFKEYRKYSYGAPKSLCRLCERARERTYYQKNIDKRRERVRTYAREHAAERKAYQREYYYKNHEKCKKSGCDYGAKNRARLSRQTTERRRSDNNFRLRSVLRTRLWHALKGSYKSGSAVGDLGCTIEEFKTHTESKWEPGMTWENHGPAVPGKRHWQLDHVIPLSCFDLTNREELLRACHYTNIQPLWWQDNLSKGATMNKIHKNSEVC